jgi:hypothetical protein
MPVSIFFVQACTNNLHKNRNYSIAAFVQYHFMLELMEKIPIMTTMSPLW